MNCEFAVKTKPKRAGKSPNRLTRIDCKMPVFMGSWISAKVVRLLPFAARTWEESTSFSHALLRVAA